MNVEIGTIPNSLSCLRKYDSAIFSTSAKQHMKMYVFDVWISGIKATIRAWRSPGSQVSIVSMNIARNMLLAYEKGMTLRSTTHSAARRINSRVPVRTVGKNKEENSAPFPKIDTF